MNELRMYVEHLFEGKVLTPETIELKEEIYGNLMARYEDYVAQGLSEAEALERTKASITDVDAMMEGDTADGADDAAPAAPTAQIPSAAQTTPMPASAAQAADGGHARPTGAPVAPEGVTAPSQPSGAAAQGRPAWVKVVAIAAVTVVVAIIALLAIGYGVNEFIVDPIQDHQEDVAEAQAEQQLIDRQNSAGDSATTGADGAGGSSQGQSTGGNQNATPQFDDPEDQLEYEASMALMDEVDGSTAESLRAAVGTNLNDTAAVLATLRSMPLGSYAGDVSTDGAGSSMSVEYASVNHYIEGDAVDSAISYDVTAWMAMYPSLQTVQVTINEDDDHDRDYDLYVFDRATVESLLANASSNAITLVNDSLLESEDSWNQVRGYVAGHVFADALMERAERS